MNSPAVRPLAEAISSSPPTKRRQTTAKKISAVRDTALKYPASAGENG
jgi:hypothetical protein